MAADAGLDILDTVIEQRIAYAEALTMGKTIFEWARNSPAALEIVTLTQELLGLLDEQIIHDRAKAKAANA